MSGSDPSVRRQTRAAEATSLGGVGGGAASGTGADGGDGAGGDCPGPDFEAVLASPSPDVVATLGVGDLLDIIAVEAPFRGVMAVTLNGALVGALTRDLVRLRRCIEAGATYEAEVLRIAGGSVRVLVRAQFP